MILLSFPLPEPDPSGYLWPALGPCGGPTSCVHRAFGGECPAADVPEWRRVPGAPDYEVSNDGQVRSWRLFQGRPGPRLLSGWLNPLGYRIVDITMAEGERRRFMVHGLVLLAFVGPKGDGQVTRHLNGNPDDNRLENLTYGTPSENALDAVRHGTHKDARKTHCARGHEYSPENTVIRKSTGERRCRTCRRQQSQEGNWRRRGVPRWKAESA